MTRKEWADIRSAADLLGLGDKANLAQIKKAYRRLSKKYHPDMQKSSQQEATKEAMHKLTEAYQTLLRYCTDYKFPFIPADNEQLDAEDWWFERFGQDHLWGRGDMSEDDPEK